MVDYHLSLFLDLALDAGRAGSRGTVLRGAEPETRDRGGTRASEDAGPRRRRAASGVHPIVIHPGSGSRSKNWPIGRFIEVAECLEGGSPIAWVIGPAEEESGSALAIERAIPAAQVRRNLPLPELADRLAVARLFVGNDSGVAHLAAAVGCPVVVLFGASDPVVWAPRGRSVTVVGDGACGMEAIGVEAVLAACRTILAISRRTMSLERCFGGFDSDARVPCLGGRPWRYSPRTHSVHCSRKVES